MADKVALAFAMLERIEWLESKQGVNLLSDDGGKWALSGDGMQPVPDADGFTEVVGITSWVEPQNWKPTIVEAIDFYRQACAAEEADAADGASR